MAKNKKVLKPNVALAHQQYPHASSTLKNVQEINPYTRRLELNKFSEFSKTKSHFFLNVELRLVASPVYFLTASSRKLDHLPEDRHNPNN